MSKIIAHIDLDAFFATCEEIRDPSLIGKPVLIGHTGRSGIVSTCSYAARKYGCHSGQPMFQALQKCPQAIVIRGDRDYYSMMSHSFFGFIHGYSKYVEGASIDECYVDMTDALRNVDDPEAYFRTMQKALLESTGLKMSIGVAPTRFLAKMASDMQKPLGLTILRKKDISTMLYPLPIEKFWGIGKKTSPKLRKMGIETIGDLAKRLNEDDPILKDSLGKFYETIKEWVNGGGSDEIDLSTWDPKSVSRGETFSHDADLESEVAPYIRKLAKEVSDALKQDKKVGNTITLQVKDTNFRLYSKSVTIKDSTDDSDVIASRCIDLYRENYIGKMLRFVSVGISKLTNPVRQNVQMTFWNYQDFEEKDQTKLLIEELNRKADKPLFKRGSQAESGRKKK
ncbi:MAG: DNA polymerase IV [Bacilli bacterium]|nr:DNA polymerase IV [Bacilli bacterium]